jgi:diguanylate cyclase (GGDEF)-like protein
VTEPTRRRPSDGLLPDQRIRRSWWIFAATFLLLTLLLLARLLIDGGRALDWLVVALALVVGIAAFRHRRAVAELEAGRRAEAESFARILSGLSRSVSEEAILAAIVEELASAAGADHIVVARRSAEPNALEATLISARPGVPPSTTLLAFSGLDEPLTRRTRRQVSLHGRPGPGSTAAAASEAAQVVADRIAEQVRSAYGLAHMLAAPLRSPEGVVGAIVISRRSPEPWSAMTRRLLNGAALEASAALSRAGSHRAAEVQASTDALTGLPNRRYFDEFCSLLARRRRSEDALGVLMVDIDRFKALNDRYGHAAGDDVLKAVGRAIVGAVRDDDVPARYGGEEFVVLLRNPSERVALEIGERVRGSVAALDLSQLGIPAVSVSVGVAVADRPDQPIDELVDDADQALYRAKRAGRDRVVAA